MFKKALVFGLFPFSYLILISCASTPQQKLDAKTDLRSKTLAVLPVGMPKQPVVNVTASTVMAFGLVGGLIEGGIIQKRMNDLAALLQAQNFDFHTEISNDLVSVADNVARVIALDTNRTGVERFKWVTTLPTTLGADAYLDVYFVSFGYVAQSDAAPFVPSVDMRARITDAAGATLFATRIIYNPDLDLIGNFKGSKLPVDKQFQFASMDAFKANPEKTVDGLKAAISAVLHELSLELNVTSGASAVAKVY